MKRISTWVDGSGVAVGFVARHGVAVAELESARALRPTRCVHLGEAPAEAPPALARVGGRVAAAWIDLDGAHVGYLGERGHRLSESAHAVHLAVSRAGFHVVVAGEVLTRHDLDHALRPCAAPEVLLARRDVRMPSLHTVGAELLLAYVLDDPALVVHRLGAGGGRARANARLPWRGSRASRRRGLGGAGVRGVLGARQDRRARRRARALARDGGRRRFRSRRVDGGPGGGGWRRGPARWWVRTCGPGAETRAALGCVSRSTCSPRRGWCSRGSVRSVSALGATERGRLSLAGP